MAGKQKYTVKQVGAALVANVGFVSMAAEALGCNRRTVGNYINRYPELAELKNQIEEERLDLCESKLMEQIEAGNLTAIIFYLKCKGKDRGYVEKQIIKSEGSLLLGEDSEYQRMKAAGEELRQTLKKMAEGKYKAPKKIEAPVLNEGEEG